jgi:hypothetical protein
MISRLATRRKSSPRYQHRPHKDSRQETSALDHAVRLIHRVCCLAGTADLLDEIRNDDGGVGITASIRNGDTPALFDWLVSALSYQGISDQVAEAYMDRYGSATWADIRAKLVQGVTCPNSRATGTFMAAATTRVAGPVRSRITSRRARCRPIICGTAG